MELKIKIKRVQEAVQIIDKLIKLEPEDSEWPLLKSRMYSYSGDTESAKNGFNEILSKVPLRVEAYHGLVIAASQGHSASDLKDVEKRIRERVEMVKKQNEEEDLMDFMLLLAQVRVIEGDYNCKGRAKGFLAVFMSRYNIYSVEEERNFQKYGRLVSEGHPYARYFDDNMNATKLFSQKLENERARARS